MDLKTESCEERGQQLLGLSLAVFLLLLTSFVNLCHTCHLRSLLYRSPIAGRLLPAENGSEGDAQAETDEPCLACMFLKAASTVQISPFFIVFLAATLVCYLYYLRAGLFSPIQAFSSLQSRAPPLSFAQV